MHKQTDCNTCKIVQYLNTALKNIFLLDSYFQFTFHLLIMPPTHPSTKKKGFFYISKYKNIELIPSEPDATVKTHLFSYRAPAFS